LIDDQVCIEKPALSIGSKHLSSLLPYLLFVQMYVFAVIPANKTNNLVV